MICLNHLFALVIGFFRIGITPVKTTVDPAASSGSVQDQAGALPSASGIVGLFQNLKNNAAPAFGNTALATKSGTTNTWSALDMVGGLIKRFGSQSAADITATATEIIAAIPGAVVGQTFPLVVANLSSVGVLTPAAGTGVTLLGTTTINRLTSRWMVGKVTGSAAVTLEGGFTFPNFGID